MFRYHNITTNRIDQNPRTYRCQHTEVTKHIREAQQLEQAYRLNAKGIDIKDIEKAYHSAYRSIHNPAKTQLDQGYSRYCYAKMLFELGDKHDECAMLIAKLKVNAACNTFQPAIRRNQSLNEKSMLLVQYVRTLDLKRKIGYKTADGTEINTAADAIINIYQDRQLPNDEYLVRAYEAKFHCHYANSEIEQAEIYHNLASQTAKQCKVKYNTVGHRIKLNMLNLIQLKHNHAPTKMLRNFFETQIEKPFWDLYDSAKEEYQTALETHRNHNSATRQLKRRMEMLFNLRCIRASIGIADEQGRTPMNYIRQQAHKNIKNSADRNMVIKAVNALAKTYKANQGMITLSHSYLGTQNLPTFIIPKQKTEILLETDFHTSINLGEEGLFSLQRNKRTPQFTPAAPDESGLAFTNSI